MGMPAGAVLLFWAWAVGPGSITEALRVEGPERDFLAAVAELLGERG